MELKRYQDRSLSMECEAVQLTPENLEEAAAHFQLEYVKEHVDEDGTVEEALFRPGCVDALHVGDFVVKNLYSSIPAYGVYAGDFDFYFKEIESHPFVPQIIYSGSEFNLIPCVICGHHKDDAPYHRDGIPGEKFKLPDGTHLTIINK